MEQFSKSFFHALRGVWFALKNERNFQIHCTVAGAVVLLMLWLPLSRMENAALIIMIALVLGFELVNTALERVMDILKPRIHPYARVIKDLMAGVVMIAAGAAILVGSFIFSPYFFK